MTKKIKTLTMICLAVLASLLLLISATFNKEVRSAYANEAVAQVDVVELSGLGLGINVLTASSSTDFKTGYSILDYDELQQLNAYQTTHNITAPTFYSTTRAEELLSNSSIDFGVDVGCETFVTGINLGLGLGTTINFDNYSYKYYYVFTQVNNRYQCYIEDYAQQSTYQDKYSSSFLSALNDLQNNLISYETFFNMFGTHLVGSAIYGGRLNAYYTLLSNKVDFNEEIKNTIEGSISYLDFSTATLSNVTSNLNQTYSRNYSVNDIQTSFSAIAQGGSVFSGTGINNFNSSYTSWCASFDDSDNCVVVDFNDGGLVPLWEILPSQYSSLSQSMKNSFINLCENSRSEFIDKYNTANYQDFNGGSGISSDPYLISNATHLRNIEKYMYAHYKLQNNIDIGGYAQWNAIGGHYKENAFIGGFDGDGFAIVNMKRTSDIAEQNNRAYFGLFGYIGSGAIVENLCFLNANINFTGPAVNNGNMRFFIGLVAGYSENATITNINTSSGSIIYNCRTNGMTYAGSVVGFANDCNISYCFNDITVYVERAGAVAGGIIGYAKYGAISYCSNNVAHTAICAKMYGWARVCGILGESLNGTTSISYCTNYKECTAGAYGIGWGFDSQYFEISFNTNADY